MVPSEASQYQGIIHLLQHFRWKWIGLIAPNDDNGERFVRTLMPLLTEHDLCVAFTETMETTISGPYIELWNHIVRVNSTFYHNKVNVVVVYGHSRDLFPLTVWMDFTYKIGQMALIGKVWIMTVQWDFTAMDSQGLWFLKPFNGALSFTSHTNNVPEFWGYLQDFNLWPSQNCDFMRSFSRRVFHCYGLYSDLAPSQRENICGGEKRLDLLPGAVFELSMSGPSYGTYNAVHMVARALDKMYSYRSQSRKRRDRLDLKETQPWQVSNH